MKFSEVFFFWTKGTAHFHTKEAKQLEAYHLIGSFEFQGAEVWVNINKKYGG